MQLAMGQHLLLFLLSAPRAFQHVLLWAGNKIDLQGSPTVVLNFPTPFRLDSRITSADTGP